MTPPPSTVPMTNLPRDEMERKRRYLEREFNNGNYPLSETTPLSVRDRAELEGFIRGLERAREIHRRSRGTSTRQGGKRKRTSNRKTKKRNTRKRTKMF